MMLLDANILLEMIIPGRQQKEAIFAWLEEQAEQPCISMLTVHLVMHFGLKNGQSTAELKAFLANYPKMGLLPEDYETALDMLVDRDHEDALQLAVAARTGCTRIVTFDRKFAANYQHRLPFTVVGA